MAGKQGPKEATKCVVVQLPVSLVKKLDDDTSQAGKSKNAILVELIETGLQFT